MIQTVYRFALAAAFCAGLCCGNDDDDGDGIGGATAQEITNDCKQYCDRAQVCDGDVEADECLAKCRDRLGNCMADEQGQTLDDLVACSKETCDDFTGCTIGAGLQCVFGL
ncbi:MAG: hypothetical protein H0T76_18665 [Nannocystis sp.]|nr:hypothetical protein [Nannocystis sp.]MBA3548510.1 hypothetical protein [Nannocystis sp.]